MTDKQKKNRGYQREYRKKMTGEQKQKLRDYLRESYKKYYIAKKLNNKTIDDNDNENENDFITSS